MVKNLFFLLLWESFYGNPFMGIQSVMRRYNSHYIHPYMELLSSEQDLFSLKMIPGHFFCTFPACLWKWRLSAKLDIWQHTVHTAVTAWKGQQHLHIKIMWPESGLTNQKKKKKKVFCLRTHLPVLLCFDFCSPELCPWKEKKKHWQDLHRLTCIRSIPDIQIKEISMLNRFTEYSADIIL